MDRAAIIYTPTVRPMKVSPVLSFEDENRPAENTKSWRPVAWSHLCTSERIRLVLMFVYTTHIISNALAGSFRTGSIMYIIETSTYTSRCCVATIGFTYICSKRKSWKALQSDLENINLSVVIYNSLLIVTTGLFFVLVPAQKYFDKCFYGISLTENGISTPLAILIGLTEWNWYNVLVSTSPLLITDMIYFSDLMRAQIKEYKHKCHAKRAEQIDDVQKLTNELTGLMCRLDSFYSPLVFLWCVDLLTNIVLPIRTLVNGIASFTLANVANFLIEAIYSTSFFLILSFSLAEISREATSLDEEVYQMRRKIPSKDFVDIYTKLILLDNGIRSCKFTIGGLGLFEVDRPFILTLTGAVVTYTIVLLQLAPGDTY